MMESKSWDLMQRNYGWHTECARSPLTAVDPDAVVEGGGWESAAFDRVPIDNWEYGVMPTSTCAGFRNRAEKTYYSKVKRRRIA